MHFSDSISVTHDYLQDNKTRQVVVIPLNFLLMRVQMKSQTKQFILY